MLKSTSLVEPSSPVNLILLSPILVSIELILFLIAVDKPKFTFSFAVVMSKSELTKVNDLSARLTEPVVEPAFVFNTIEFLAVLIAS